MHWKETRGKKGKKDALQLPKTRKKSSQAGLQRKVNGRSSQLTDAARVGDSFAKTGDFTKEQTRTAVRSVRSLPALLLEKMRWETEMEIGRGKRAGEGREREMDGGRWMESGRWMDSGKGKVGGGRGRRVGEM